MGIRKPNDFVFSWLLVYHITPQKYNPGLVMGRTIIIPRACHGPTLVGRPVTFSHDGSQPGPAHHLFRGWASRKKMKMSKNPAESPYYIQAGYVTLWPPVILETKNPGTQEVRPRGGRKPAGYREDARRFDLA